MIIIFSVSVRESKSSLDSLKSGHKIAQTQTEKKISFLQQLRYCFMGNEKYRYITFTSPNVPFATDILINRKEREKKAVLAGVSFNSVSRIDSCARYQNKLLFNHFHNLFLRLLFPLSFMTFNLFYWTIYFKTAKDFSWGNHAVKGNIGE